MDSNHDKVIQSHCLVFAKCPPIIDRPPSAETNCRTFANRICGKNAKEQASPFRLRLQACDLICRHDLNLWLPVAKSDCARDADRFSLDHGKSLISRYCGPGRNVRSD
jgi:hypothetical protein